MSIRSQYFDERFSASATVHPPLPFFHTCDAGYFQDILDGRQLIPTPCDVYKEDLLYLFYGKPAYKSGEVLNSKLVALMPLCFIVNYNAITSIKRMLAFDSGAFPMYERFIHKSMTKEQFELTPSKNSLNKMIEYFFANNDSYFNGEPRQSITYDKIHFQVESYHSLLKSDGLDAVDDRKSTLEIQLDHPIALNNSNIEAIILPKSLSTSDTVKKIITDDLHIPMIEIKNYGVSSQKYYTEILDKTREFLVSKSLIYER
jgi:hypothetical protein